MKKLALIIGLVVAANILFAQEKKGPVREEAQVKLEEYKERLKLTDSQLAELKKLREEAKPDLEAIRMDDAKSRSEKMEARAEIMKKQEAKVAEILNDEQEAELKVIQREIRDNARERRERKRERRDG